MIQQLAQSLLENGTSATRAQIARLIKEQRAAFNTEVAATIGNEESPLRRLVFEELMIDGANDMIEAMVACIRAEKNPLHMRKQLALISQVKGHQVIDALETLEHSIPTEIRPAWLRLIGQAKANYPEYFNIKEFRKGITQLKRLKAASQRMADNPHPSYLPFLNGILKESDGEPRLMAIKLLKSQGDLSSIEVMKPLLVKLLTELNRGLTFLSMAIMTEQYPSSKEMLNAMISGLEDNPHINLDPAFGKTYTNMPLSAAVNGILEPFHFKGQTIQLQANNFLEKLFDGTQPNKDDRLRLKQVIETHNAFLQESIDELALAMGTIAGKLEFYDITRELMDHLPEEDSNYLPILTKILSGFGNEEARDQLLVMLAKSSSTKGLIEILEALSCYQLPNVVHRIHELAGNPDDTRIRNAALRIIAAANMGYENLRILLDHPSLIVRADVVKQIAHSQIIENHIDLMNLLQKEIPDSLKLIVFTALESFDSPMTGAALSKFILPPHSHSTREAAMSSLLKAGGPHRIKVCLETLHQCPLRCYETSAQSFLDLLLGGVFDFGECMLLQGKHYWSRIFNHESAELRRKGLTIFEQFQWNHDEAMEWTGFFREALGAEVVRPEAERNRIKTLIVRIETRHEARDLNQQQQQKLEDGLQNMESQFTFRRVLGMRVLEEVFSKGFSVNDSHLAARLATAISDFYSEHEDNKQYRSLAIDVARRIQHPLLEQFLRIKTSHEPKEKTVEHSIKTVLAMDDSQYITKTLTKILEPEGYEVTTRNDANMGLILLKHRSFDLLILDLNMPGVPGLDFMKRINKEGIRPKQILILTGNRVLPDLKEVSLEGVDGILLKPFRPQDILERLHSLEVVGSKN